MFDQFKQLGELKKMRDQAMQIQKALSQEHIEVEENGIKIVISGDQKIEEVLVNGEENWQLKETINKAIKKSQEVAAKKLQEMGGGLGGLLGQ
jgi:nucleoid-associated protein EbfC